MFSFPDADVDFYLPQLVSMYIQMHDVAEVIHPYLVHRYVFPHLYFPVEVRLYY